VVPQPSPHRAEPSTPLPSLSYLKYRLHSLLVPLYEHNRTLLSKWYPQPPLAPLDDPQKSLPVLTDLILDYSGTLRPLLRTLLARGLSVEVSIFMQEVEEDVRECIEVISEVIEGYRLYRIVAERES